MKRLKIPLKFDSEDENAFRVQIGDNIGKFLANNNGIYLSEPDKKF